MGNRVRLVDIFIAFLKSGLILLGGGYVILPILQSEIVDKRGWISQEELSDYYAVSQSLPGLVAINLSILIGYKLRGKSGALIGVTGITFFAFFAIVIFSSILTSFSTNTYIQGTFLGIGIAVVVLIISAIREMWNKAINGAESVILFLIAFILMHTTDISPAFVILLSIPAGILWNMYKRSRRTE